MENDNTKNQNEYRELFEKDFDNWLQAEPDFTRDKNGVYTNEATHWAHKGWQAARLRANPAPSRMPENEANKNVGELVEGWPDNIAADRHEISGKWVLHYLTDDQAALCKAALSAIRQHSSVKVDDEVLNEMHDFLSEWLGDLCLLQQFGSRMLQKIKSAQEAQREALRSSETPNGEGEV
jgi:hypothetical protein